MRRFVLFLLRRAFAWPHWPSYRLAPRCMPPRDHDAAVPGAVTCRRAWGAIRARYRLKDLVVPA